MKDFKLLWLLAAACSLTFASCNKDNDGPDTSTTVTFESATLPDAGYINNTSYTEQGVTFNNVYDVQGQYMSAGFAVSKLHDKVTAGYTNMYSVYGDGGAAGSVNFAVCYFAEYLTNTSGVNDAYFSFGAGIEKKMLNVMVNNGTYAYLAIKNRNDGSNPPRVKEFTDGDWFKVTFTGYNAAGTKTNAVDYYLADYRNGKNFVCSAWTNVDLSGLGTVNKVVVSMSSSDSGDWGMNTPSYVCIDNLKFDLPDVAQ